jgi:hypothetical protein
LHNRTYIGETHHKGRYFKGEHKGIVLRPQFEAVQKRLEELAPASTFQSRSTQDAPLTGLVFDEAGMAMLPTYTIKHGNQRYRYYTSRPAMIGERAKAAIHRIPAPKFEALLTRSLARLGLAASDPVTLTAFVRRIDVLPSSLRLRLDSEQVCAAWRTAKSAPTGMRARDFLADYRDCLLAGEFLTEDGDDLILLLPVCAKFRGGGATLYPADGPIQPRPDAALLKAIARAWRWREMLVSGEAKSIEDIAARHGQDRGHVGKILNLAFLSPAVIRSIVHGDQPAGLRLTHLLDARLPLDWDEQTVFLQRLSGGPAEMRGDFEVAIRPSPFPVLARPLP